VSGGVAPDLVCRIARSPAEIAGYFRLRRDIFVEEQQIYGDSDRDALDEGAIPIVCLALPDGADASIGGASPRVVGVVRIWEEAPGQWWGGRLGVERAFRTNGGIGRRLVQTAVGSARAWGAWQFRATVQRANVAFFRRLHWRSLEQLEIRGWAHHLMQAELERYPPTAEVRPPHRPANTAAGARHAAA
jgi:putative N-acetyltransferase (TIGR04045 family)